MKPATPHSRIFNQGLALLRSRNLVEATNAFQRAFEADRENPRYISYCGLMLALSQTNFHKAVQLCQDAVERAPYDAELYLNLSRAYEKAGQPQKAMQTLRAGLGFDEDSPVLMKEIARIDMRRKPWLGFLSRQHPLNRAIGKLTYKG